MKRLKYLLIGLLVALPLFGWVAVANAQSFRSGNNVTLAQNATLDQTLFAYGKTLDIAGTVNGDVFCAGQNITVSGVVNGDVICAGQNVAVTGQINGDVRLAGQNVTLNGQVSGNASIASQSFVADSKSKLGGDLSLAGQDTTLNGQVGRDIAGASDTLTINSVVGRDIRAQVKTLSLGANAQVGGNIDYTSDKTLTRNSEAVVGGSITRNSPTPHRDVRLGSVMGFAAWMAAYMFVSLLLLALVLVLLLPRAFHVATEIARRHMIKTFFVGLAASILVPVVLVGLMFTVVGIPLALFGFLVWFVLVILSGPFAAYLLGRLVLHNATNNAIWTMLFGSVVILLLYFVPFLGVITSLVALWFGLGTILMRASHLPRPHYNMAPVATAKKK